VPGFASCANTAPDSMAVNTAAVMALKIFIEGELDR
jgi:hypothetical protein